jgi:HPt (histidine-containing phosphotransfer) domain-containing protein
VRLVIDISFEKGELKQSVRRVHTVKGVAAIIGANDLAIAAQLIKATLSNNGKNVEKTLVKGKFLASTFASRISVLIERCEI